MFHEYFYSYRKLLWNRKKNRRWFHAIRSSDSEFIGDNMKWLDNKCKIAILNLSF